MPKYFIQLEQAACRVQFRDDSPAFIRGWLPQLWQQVEGCPEHGTSNPLPDNALANQLSSEWPYTVVFQKGTLLLALASDTDSEFLQQVMSQWCQALIENQWPAAHATLGLGATGQKVNLPGETLMPTRLEPEEITTPIVDAALVQKVTEKLAQQCTGVTYNVPKQQHSMLFDIKPAVSSVQDDTLPDQLAPEPEALTQDEIQEEEFEDLTIAMATEAENHELEQAEEETQQDISTEQEAETSLSFELTFAEGEIEPVFAPIEAEDEAEIPLLMRHTASRAEPELQEESNEKVAIKRRPLAQSGKAGTSKAAEEETTENINETFAPTSKKAVPANALSALGKAK